MNPFKTISNVINTILTCLLLSWFGLQCIKLGWYSHSNPLLRAIVSTLPGVETKAEENSSFESNWFDKILLENNSE